MKLCGNHVHWTVKSVHHFLGLTVKYRWRNLMQSLKIRFLGMMGQHVPTKSFDMCGGKHAFNPPPPPPPPPKKKKKRGGGTMMSSLQHIFVAGMNNHLNKQSSFPGFETPWQLYGMLFMLLLRSRDTSHAIWRCKSPLTSDDVIIGRLYWR